MPTIKDTLKNYLQKIPAFLSGFMLGVLLTGAFFIFKINEYILQFKETVYPKITVTESQVTSTKDNDTKSIASKKKHKQQKDTALSSINNTTLNDSSSTSEIETEQDHLAIVEEQTLSEKEFKIIHLENTHDTTFSTLAEVPTPIRDNSIKVIFKKTPFNSKGYYFENNHLVLVGLQDIPYINLYEYKGELYCKYDKVVFKLSYTNTFENLIKLEDELILAKMN